ncbi:MAG: hypothetical protein IBX41_01580 [Methanophagales archaeon]|nr:hypothetical protein [Methanophagales archaeon]
MNENTMKKWKLGAIIGAIWGLLGAIFIPTVMWRMGMLMPGETPPPDYIYALAPIGMIAFFSLFWSVGTMLSVLNSIFPTISFPDSFVLLLYPVHGALIGAGVGYFIDKYRR